MRGIEVKARHHAQDRVWDVSRRGHKLFTLVVDRGGLRPLRGPYPFGVYFHKGQHGGAGYIGGWSFYFVLNGERTTPYRQRRAVWLGFTRNANRVPWVNH